MGCYRLIDEEITGPPSGNFANIFGVLDLVLGLVVSLVSLSLAEIVL